MRLLVCALITAAAALAASPVVPYAIHDAFTPAPLEGQKIEGLLGERMRVNLEGRLLHVDEKALLEGFQHPPGKQEWIGEHVGKYLEAGCRVWRITHDERLKTQMDRMVRALIAAQHPDGYLGTYVDAKRWTSWDVWVHKYNLLGLLAYYETFDYPPALDASRKIGDLLHRTFGDGEGKRDIIASSTHQGMAATSVLEPVMYLYRDTGDQRYLDFARYILRAWEQPNGPKIISSLRSTGSVFKTANAKAYEMMSDLVGLTEYARVTNDLAALEAAKTAWNDIRTHRLYITGTTSSHEHFLDDAVLPGEQDADVGEGCATVTWLQLTWQLLRITGEPKYAEEVERTVYNQLLGAQDPANGNICYFTPLDGRKKATPGINCCVSSEPRGISMIPQFAWGELGKGIAILLYTPGRMTTSLATIHSTTAYPLDGVVDLRIMPIKPGAKFPLAMRVPAWTRSFTATIGTEKITGKPGQYLILDRKWKAGDTVHLEIEMTTRVLSGAPTYKQSVAIARGPQVLALEESLNPKVPHMENASPIAGAELKRVTIPVEWSGRQVYTIAGADSQTLLLVPFADAKSYRVWLAKP